MASTVRPFCASFFVLPSDVEGMAVSLLEAMSYGNCCLVSDIRENTEVVDDHAVSFRKSDTEALREKMEYLLNHPEVRKAYQEQASAYICEKYNWDDVAEQTLKLYEDGVTR